MLEVSVMSPTLGEEIRSKYNLKEYPFLKTVRPKEEELIRILGNRSATALPMPVPLQPIPKAIDYSQYIHFVREQGAWGCFAYSLAACMDILNEMKCPYSPNISVNRQLWGFNFQIRGEKVPWYGEEPTKTFEEYITKYGCPTEGTELTDSDGLKWPMVEGDAECPNFKLAGPSTSIKVDLTEIKNALAAKGPLRIGAWDCHFVALVGYDDVKQRLKFINSGGDQWGENGFGYIDYAKLSQEVQTVEFFDAIPPSPIPTARIAFTSEYRQDLYLWIGIDGKTSEKRIWPSGQRQDKSKNLEITVTLPVNLSWPEEKKPPVGEWQWPTTKGLYLDIFHSGAHSESSGKLVDFTVSFQDQLFKCKQLGQPAANLSPHQAKRFMIYRDAEAAAKSTLTSITFNGDPRVYYINPYNRVHELAWWGSNWHCMIMKAPADAPNAKAGKALTSTTLGGDPRIYYLGGNNHIYELAYLAKKWNLIDTTAVVGGQPAALGSALTSTTLGGNPRIYYIDSNSHINELAWNPGWKSKDLTALVGGQPAVLGSTLASTTVGGNPRVYYLNGKNHICEMAWNPGWNFIDATTIAGGQPVAGSALTVTTLGGNLPRIYYLDGNNHVNELAWNPGWKSKDLTAAIGGQPAAPGSALTSTTLGGNPRIYYIGGNNHIYELSWNPGWKSVDLIAATGGLPAAVGSALTSTTLGGNPRIYYIGGNNHIYELAWNPGWKYRDVLADSS
jgi:hypothetical protein